MDDDDGHVSAQQGAELTPSNLSEPLLSESPPPSKDIVLSCGSHRSLRLNHNVFLTLVLDILYGVSDGLWGGTVLAAYLKRAGHGRNGPVGNIEAVNGMAVLLSALPVGYLADTIGRDAVIRAGGILIVVTTVCHIAVLEYIGVDETAATNNSTSMVLLGIIMALWGVASGIVSGPCQALYADSTPAGSRTQYYQYLFVCYTLASCLGPLVSIILFQTLGDDWSLQDLRIILYVGLGLEFVNAFLMMFFDDKKALDEEEEEEEREQGESGDNGQQTGPCLDSTNDCEGGGAAQGQATETVVAAADDDDDAADAATAPESAASDRQRLKERQKWIPYILFGASLIYSIGSGMTVKFFPLFFKDDVGLSPTEVQIIYFLVPLTMVSISGLGTKVASWFGRVQTTLLLDCLGVSCLYSMVLFKQYLDSHPFVLVPIYIVRTALMNSSYPLLESILMDFVPKKERARWKSLESVSVFGWCGSAALGGYVSDRSDYTHTFFVTASIQSSGILLLSLLLPLVPRREQDLARRDDEQEEEEEEPVG